MKRYNFYESDQQSLMDVYSTLNKREMYSSVVQMSEAVMASPYTSIKIFTQQPGRGADLTFFGKNVKLLSSDGDGGMILNAQDGEKTIQVTTTKTSAQVKIVGNDGLVVDEFVTNVPPRSGTNELIIININEL